MENNTYMNDSDIYRQLFERLPAFQNQDLMNFIQENGNIISLKKNETLVRYQEKK